MPQTSGNAPGISKVTGEPVRIWNGTQTLDGDTLHVEYAVRPDGTPHTVLLDSNGCGDAHHLELRLGLNSPRSLHC